MKKILKIIAILIVTASVVLSAGCAEKSETAGNESQENSEQISPATPETGLLVTEADSGTKINLKNGENFTLQFRGNPTTGYSWELNLSEGLSILSEDYIQDEAPEGKAGVPGTYLWRIQAVEKGSQKINGIYKRSWENTTGTEENFTLTVEVR